MEVMLLKTPQGALIPMDEDEAAKLRKFQAGTLVRGEYKTVRNGAFFKKWFSLARLAFELSSERMTPHKYKGEDVLPNFERFRKDLTVLAGYYDPVFGADGSVRLEAKSLQWSKMKEPEFAQLYSATIDVILQKILPHLGRDELENAVNATMAYA